MTIERTLWTTVEFVAWSQSLQYDGYLELHHKMQCKGAIVSEDGYLGLCRVFDAEMDASFKPMLATGT